MSPTELITEFLELQKNYQFTRRALMTKERFKDIAKGNTDRGLDTSDDSLKEALIEHVGHLPIVASFFHEHATHVSEINLGRALVMLSIHDIGETKLGDKFTYTKTKQEEIDEIAAAELLITPALRPYFDEYEAGETLDAKYAKSIDILAPNIHELDMVYLIQKRFEMNGAHSQDIIQRKRKYMEWDPALLQVFDLCVEQIRRAEHNEELLFPVVAYDLK